MFFRRQRKQGEMGVGGAAAAGVCKHLLAVAAGRAVRGICRMKGSSLQQLKVATPASNI